MGIATAPDRRPTGQSGREGYQRPRARKLTVEDQDAVRLEADKGRSLRSLAAEFGVSHESIRTVVRDRGCDGRLVVPEATRA